MPSTGTSVALAVPLVKFWGAQKFLCVNNAPKLAMLVTTLARESSDIFIATAGKWRLRFANAQFRVDRGEEKTKPNETTRKTNRRGRGGGE